MEEPLKNLFDKVILQEHLTFIALFIGMYENFIDTIESRVESFLCDELNRLDNGELRYKKTELYKNLIEKRRVDDLGNKNALKATMLWFVDEMAISKDEYDQFIVIKQKRDKYVHQMTDFIWNGINEKDVQIIMNLLDLFCKLDKWWLNEIEIPIAGDEVKSDYDRDGVQSLNLMAYKYMLNVLYGEKSDEYVDELNKVINSDKL